MSNDNETHRNMELAVIAKNDPARLRIRVVEGERRKRRHSRARRKETWLREKNQEES